MIYVLNLDDFSFEKLLTREQKIHLFDVENDSHIWVLYAATLIYLQKLLVYLLLII